MKPASHARASLSPEEEAQLRTELQFLEIGLAQQNRRVTLESLQEAITPFLKLVPRVPWLLGALQELAPRLSDTARPSPCALTWDEQGRFLSALPDLAERGRWTLSIEQQAD